MLTVLKSLIRRLSPSLAEIRTALLLAVAVVLTPVLCAYLLITEPMPWLPKASEAGTLLSTLLGAQAAIAALTLAVTLFVMQGVSARRDVDDRIYVEYVRRSWVRVVFWGSIIAVAVTGAVLMAEAFVGDAGKVAETIPGVPNLALIAVMAFLANLLFALTLFERAIRLARPEHWRSLRQDVNKRDVRHAIRAFIGRYERARTAHAAGEADLSIMFPDHGEGSADQAIRGLLDDARRAMAERRQAEFESALNSIKELVTYAMDEMEKAGMQWGDPGSQPEWPPLRELGRNLYPFREEVIREGSREYVLELLRLDYWLATNGVRRSCGELFSTGLSGYRLNYQITTRLVGGEFHEMIRDRFSLNLDGLSYSPGRGNLHPFLGEMIKHQERMLSDAMQANQVGDYERLHVGFNSRFWDTLRYREFNEPSLQETANLDNSLRQQYRIALMGLAGHAIILAESSTISDETLYLNITREVYTRTELLGDDIAAALMNERRFGFSLWHDWDVPDDNHGQVVTIAPEKYPLTYFAVRLMELVDNATPPINLHGNARHALDWFDANSERLERFVQDTPTLSVQQRRELATAILQEAVRRDEIAEDHKIIRRELSEDRIANIKSSVHEAMLAANSVEHLFEQAESLLHLERDLDDDTKERGFHQLHPKAYFCDAEENDQIYYAAVPGEQWGRSLADDAAYMLCESLEGAIPMTARLDSLESLLRSIDMAIGDIASQGAMAIVLAGDWGDIERALYSAQAVGYEPYWRLAKEDQLTVAGRYQGHPILKGSADGERRLYVFEPSTWGHYIRAQYEDGQNLRVEVKPISHERAQELLSANSAHFSDQPDDESKIRKLQTCVEVGVAIRHGFRTTDPSRARKITRGEPLTEPNA